MSITEAELIAAIANAKTTTLEADLGLGTAASHAATDFLLKSSNLSDVTSASSARTSLGLGTAATQNLLVAFPKRAVVAGAAAGNFTVTGIKTTDTLAAVIQFVGAGTAVTDIADLTSEYTISATNTINNTSGTASTGGKLLVMWIARS